MKKLLVALFVFVGCAGLFLSLVSCNHDTVTHNEEEIKKTKELRALYLEKIYGRWKCEQSSDLTFSGEDYTFMPDGSLTGHVTLKSRKRVHVDGEEVLTDWETICDTDITGKWDLLYSSWAGGKNVLFVSSDGEWGPNRYSEFITANDEMMEVQSPLVGWMVKMYKEK